MTAVQEAGRLAVTGRGPVGRTTPAGPGVRRRGPCPALAFTALADMLAAAEAVLAATGSAVALCPVYGLDACEQEAP